MLTGLILALLTGLCWTAFGIVLSFTARGKHNVVVFGIVQNTVCMVVSLLFLNYSAIGEIVQSIGLFLLIFSGGFINSLGQLVTNRGMKQGHNGMIWAISQSSMLVPFVIAALCFNQSSLLRHWVGVILILSGIILPNIKINGSQGNWFKYALSAFLLFGIVQTLYLLPSLMNMEDPAHFRPVWAALGMTSGWIGGGLCVKESLKPSRNMVILGCCIALISVMSLRLFFYAIDYLTKAGAGNIAVPLMVGCNILFFTIFSIFKIKEKISWQNSLTLILLIAGLIVLV